MTARTQGNDAGWKRWRSRRSIFMPAGLIGVIAIASGLAAAWLIDLRSAAILEDAQQRAELIVHMRQEPARGWLPRWSEATAALRENPGLQLFVKKTLNGKSENEDSTDLTAYMQAVFDGFFRRRPDVASAYLVDGEGRAFLALSQGQALNEAQRARARSLFDQGASVIDPLRKTDKGLVYDVYLPLFPAQAQTPEDAKKTIAMLVLSVKAEGGLEDVLAPGQVLNKDEKIALTQKNGATLEMALWGERGLSRVKDGYLKNISVFYEAESWSGAGDPVYYLGEPIEGTPWTLVYARNSSDLDDLLFGVKVTITLLATLAVVCTGAGVVLMWWRQSLQSSKQLTDQYRMFAEQLETERNLLNAINDAISEIIYVTNLSRQLVYANDAFPQLTGGVQGWIGKNVDIFLSPELGGLLSELDAKVLGGELIQHRVVEEDGGRAEKRWLSFSKTPLRDSNGDVLAVVTICSDITQVYLERERQRNIMRSTIRVLTSSVSAVDPFLADQADSMAETAMGIAEYMGCSEHEVETLQTAGYLSQVGKIFVPRDLIGKQGRLTPEERAELEQHIVFALDAIKDIQFELPVRETLAQLQEKLDGTGYPNHLKGDEMTLLGRILSVANVFAARSQVRGYRDAMEAKEILKILRENEAKYDKSVVDGLENYLIQSGRIS